MGRSELVWAERTREQIDALLGQLDPGAALAFCCSCIERLWPVYARWVRDEPFYPRYAAGRPGGKTAEGMRIARRTLDLAWDRVLSETTGTEVRASAIELAPWSLMEIEGGPTFGPEEATAVVDNLVVLGTAQPSDYHTIAPSIADNTDNVYLQGYASVYGGIASDEDLYRVIAHPARLRELQVQLDQAGRLHSEPLTSDLVSILRTESKRVGYEQDERWFQLWEEAERH